MEYLGWWALLAVIICIGIVTGFEIRYGQKKYKKEIQVLFKNLEDDLTAELLDYAKRLTEGDMINVSDKVKHILNHLSPYGRCLSEYRFNWWKEKTMGVNKREKKNV